MEENKIFISIPFKTFCRLIKKEEQISIIERMMEAKGYMDMNNLRAIIAVPPIPEESDKESELSFAKMFEDVPGMEEMTCT